MSSEFGSEILAKINLITTEANKRVEDLTARVKDLESELTFGIDEMERRRLWIDVATTAMCGSNADTKVAIESANQTLAAFDAQFAKRTVTP